MLDQAAKKTALRGITYGLYVIGTRKGDEVNAFTGNWLTQTSFDPPLVVLAAKKGTTSQEMIDSEGVFSVNILKSGDKHLAEKFFKPVKRVGNKLEDIEFQTEVTGCPLLKDALSWFECQVTDRIDRGDHMIFVGQVVNAGVNQEGSPLTMAETGWHYGG